jgi:hypothetical protein
MELMKGKRALAFKMKDQFLQSFSAKLIELTSELRALDLELKSGEMPEGPLLREFRQALDHVRMTAWTTNELMDAREARKDPKTVLSFLTAERLRRFTQMIKDLSSDIEVQGLTWQSQGIQSLSDSLHLLQQRLSRLAGRTAAEPSTTRPDQTR